MRSFSITLSLVAALAALTAAAPHARNKAYARGVQYAPLLAGRTVSNTGECGGSSGFTCAAGYCCSEYGYCGTSDAYCGAGCQSAYGTCGDETTTAATGTHASTSTKKATTYSATTTVTSVLSGYTTTTTTSTKKSSTSTGKATATSNTKSSTSTTSAATATSTSSSGGAGLGDSYTFYTGDGTVAEGWPAQNEWTNFESMWTANTQLINISCTEFGESNNSPAETADIKSAIESIASSSGVDQRFILAIMMQESKGCVRAPTTNYGVTNPGLMQSHDGAGSCNNGAVLNPCPASEITQMIKDGTEGTSSGDGLEQCITEAGTSDVSKYYKAARIYNSGSIASDGNLDDGIATHCYASDIANRLTGWVNAATKCTLD